MNSKKYSLISTIATLVALVLGIIISIFSLNEVPFFVDTAANIKFFGTWYVDILKILISPVIFISMSLFVLRREKKSGLFIGKTVVLFLVMFMTTFLISSLIVWIARPGVGFTGEGTSEFSSISFSVGDFFKNLLPKSIEDVFRGKCVFIVIILALLSSLIVSFTPAREKYARGLEFVKKYTDIILKAILFLTPLAVLSLVANMFVKENFDYFRLCLKYILFAYGLSLLAIIVVMILPVWIIAKINPITYVKKVAKVWLITLSTCSSVATLPYTIKTCNEDFGVDKKITDAVVPLGCTIHMCGGAVSFALLGLFVAQFTGVTISFPMFMLMFLSATLINMAAPGIPGGGVVIGLSYLSAFDFAVEGFYGIYAGIYKLLDMAYTTLNVTGDISANVILNHFEEQRLKKLECQEEAQK